MPEDVIRLIMLIGALIVPAGHRRADADAVDPGDRSAKRIAESVLRGYPLTVLLSVLLIFLAGARHLPQGAEPGQGVGPTPTSRS